MDDDIDTDPRYEYDAPMFVDFGLLQRGALEDVDADQWFGERELRGGRESKQCMAFHPKSST